MPAVAIFYFINSRWRGKVGKTGLITARYLLLPKNILNFNGIPLLCYCQKSFWS